MIDLDALAARHGLTYHLNYCRQADAMIGFQGKRVLEVGGSLPRDFVLDGLGAAQWVAIQEQGYFREVGRTDQFVDDEQVLAIDAVTSPGQLGPYAVLLGAVEDLPASLFGQFDLIFSIAAFEHIHTLGRALEVMAQALTRDGRLFTMFSPIWSARDGHHLPEIVDASGRVFNFADSPIPPWGHLLMRPPELYRHLLAHTDAKAAAQIVYYVFHSPAINRLFVEDYLGYLQASPFAGEATKTFSQPVSPDVQARLEAAHPGRAHFDNNGLMLLLHKKSEG